MVHCCKGFTVFEILRDYDILHVRAIPTHGASLPICWWTITVNDLPSKIKKMFLNSFKAVRHGSFTLVHSVVNKIWYQNTSLKHAKGLIQCSYGGNMTLSAMHTCWVNIDQ